MRELGGDANCVTYTRTQPFIVKDCTVIKFDNMSAVNFIMDGRFNKSFSFNFFLIKGKTFYTRKFSFTHSTDSSQYPDTARLVHSFNHNML